MTQAAWARARALPRVPMTNSPMAASRVPGNRSHYTPLRAPAALGTARGEYGCAIMKTPDLSRVRAHSSMVERPPHKRLVGGSIPPGPTRLTSASTLCLGGGNKGQTNG